MKKFMFVIALIAVTAGSVFAGWVKDYNEATAAVEGNAFVRAGATGEKAMATVLSYTNANNNGWASYRVMPNPFGVIAMLKDENAPQSENDLWMASYLYDNDFEDIFFAAYVTDPEVNTSLAFNVWGATANFAAPLAGQEWFVYVNGDYVDSFVWDDEHLTKDNPMYTLDFDVNDIVGLENAAVIRLSTTGPEEPETEVPEPAAFAYAAMGLVSAFGLKRRIRK